jgi:hypothetical protein
MTKTSLHSTRRSAQIDNYLPSKKESKPYTFAQDDFLSGVWPVFPPLEADMMDENAIVKNPVTLFFLTGTSI